MMTYCAYIIFGCQGFPVWHGQDTGLLWTPGGAVLIWRRFGCARNVPRCMMVCDNIVADIGYMGCRRRCKMLLYNVKKTSIRNKK